MHPISAAKVDFDEPGFLMPVSAPVIVQGRDRHSMCGAVVGPRLVPILITSNQPSNLRLASAAAFLHSFHPYSETDSLLIGNQGDSRTLTVEAIKAHKTAAQIAQMFGVHPTQVGGWKKQALAGLPDLFGNGREQMRQQSDAEKDELYKQIGQMKVELDFLKKRAGLLS